MSACQRPTCLPPANINIKCELNSQRHGRPKQQKPELRWKQSVTKCLATLWLQHIFVHVQYIPCVAIKGMKQVVNASHRMNNATQRLDAWCFNESWRSNAVKGPHRNCSGTLRSPCSVWSSTSPSWNPTSLASNWRSQRCSRRFVHVRGPLLFQRHECGCGSFHARCQGIPCSGCCSTKTSCDQTIQSTNWNSLPGSHIGSDPAGTQFSVATGHSGSCRPRESQVAWEREPGDQHGAHKTKFFRKKLCQFPTDQSLCLSIKRFFQRYGLRNLWAPKTLAQVLELKFVRVPLWNIQVLLIIFLHMDR